MQNTQTNLNRSQRKFCNTPINKSVRLLAPAGSGKTHALLWRCKFITEECKAEGLPKPHFLIVIFTKAAQLELEERLNNKDFKGIKATVSTLNAWGWEQLKTKTGRELIVSNFARKNLITHDLMPICKQYTGIGEKMKSARGQALYGNLIADLMDLYKSLGFTHLMTKADYTSHIRKLKELGIYSMLDDCVDDIKKITDIEDSKDALNEFWSFWKKSVTQLESINRFTMEDQKYWARIILEEKISGGQVAPTRSKYTHIMVDEFQDINPLDMSLIQAISLYHGGKKMLPITIVGDDDQAIFGWRGTTPKYILYPEEHLGQKFTTCVLETNYRSPKAIVEVSDRLIRNNTERVPKNVKSAAKGRAYIKVERKRNSIASINATMSLAHKLIDEKDCDKVAIIARKQASLFPYQILFSAENTKYNVDADIDIFEGEAMNSLQEILKIIYRAKSGDDDNPVGNLLAVCDKVDLFTITVAEKKELRRYLDKANLETFMDAIEVLRKYPKEIRKKQAGYFYKAIKALYSAPTVHTFMKVINENFLGFCKNYNKVDTDGHYKEPQFLRLMDISKQYGDNFMQFSKDIEKARRNSEISRERNRCETSEDYKDNKRIKLHLLTATRSKGREFDAVIIVDANEGDWPASLSDNIEEERRLFYVAMTRARKYLYFMTSDDYTSSMFLEEAELL